MNFLSTINGGFAVLDSLLNCLDRVKSIQSLLHDFHLSLIFAIAIFILYIANLIKIIKPTNRT